MATNRIAKLRSMRTDTAIKAATTFSEAYDSIQEDESIRYAVGAMQPLDPDYVANTFAEGDRIKNQLSQSLGAYGYAAEYDYQGSTTNGMQVRVHSDLDLLTVATEFYTVQPPGQVSYPYSGDPLAELKGLRSACIKIISDKFPKVTIDTTKGKCIALSGGSLRREIDVVIANWWHTLEYQSYPLPHYKGVKVLDVKADLRHENKPFLHNYRLEQKDTATSGNLRKVIRLLKSLKYNADTEVPISSYDIAAIGYTMPEYLLTASEETELILLENAKNYLASLVNNEAARNALMVPNETRKIFTDGGATYNGLLRLFSETYDLANDVANALSSSFRKIQDARIYH